MSSPTTLTSKSQALGPVEARVGRHVPGVALVLQALEEPVELGREVRLDQHCVAAHVDDVVDVLDVDRALLHAGAAGGAGPQHVGVDHGGAVLGHVEPVVAGLADQRAARPRGSGCRCPRAGPRARRSSRPGGTAPWRSAWSRSAVMRSLGESGFSVFHAGHCDWQRPHSVHVVKSRMPFQLKSSTRPDAEHGVLVEVVDVVERDRLAVGGQRLDRAQRGAAGGLALEPDVEEGEEAVPGHAHGRGERDRDHPDRTR